MAEVTDADRKAAANFYDAYLARPGEIMVANAMRAGNVDDSPVVTAFAAHREAEREATEAAIVAWLRKELIDEYGEQVAQEQSAWWFVSKIEAGAYRG